MAGKDKLRDEDEADGEEKAAKGDKKPGVMKLVILGALAVFVAALGAQVAAPLVNQMIAGGGHAAAGANASSAEIVNTRTMKSPIPLMSVCRQIMLGFEWGQLNQA